MKAQFLSLALAGLVAGAVDSAAQSTPTASEPQKSGASAPAATKSKPDPAAAPKPEAPPQPAAPATKPAPAPASPATPSPAASASATPDDVQQMRREFGEQSKDLLDRRKALLERLRLAKTEEEKARIIAELRRHQLERLEQQREAARLVRENMRDGRK